MKNNKGFSLVELIVVIAIMAILAAVAIPTFAGFIGKAQTASDESFLNDIEYALELASAGKEGGLNGEISVITASKKVSEIKVGDTTVYKTGTDAVDTYELKEVIDFNYEMKKLEDGTYKPNGEGKWTKQQ